MNNLIKTFLAFAVVLTGVLFAGTAEASVSFNTLSNDCKTVEVGRYPGSTSGGCWSGSSTVAPGDTVNIWIYYHNTGNETATDVRIKASAPTYTQVRSSHTFSGSVSASNGGYASGSDTISLSTPARLEVGQAKWYPNQSSSGQNIPNPERFFDGSSPNGYSVGNISPSWSSQGWVVLSFKVVGNTDTAACGDGIDNDGDGLIDMNDPGCSSLTDNDEYNGSSVSAPSVSTGSAASITTTSAVLRGSVNANGATTTTWFVYSTNPNRLSQGVIDNATAQVSRGVGSQDFSQSISGLIPNTTYYFRAVAQNSRGTVYASNVENFRTNGNGTTTYECNDGIDNDGDGYVDYPNDPGCSSSSDNTESPYNESGNNGDRPDVSTRTAEDIDEESATLRGTYDGNGRSTDVWFIYDRDRDNLDNYNDADEQTSRRNRGTGSGSFEENIDGLRENTRYYFRAVARNSEGITYGSIREFRTDDGNGSSRAQCDDGRDNDGDGYVDYPNDPGCSSRSDNSESPYNSFTQGGLTATTTVSTAVTQSSARINGFIVNQNCTGSTYGYFEYGQTTGLGAVTQRQSIGCGQNSMTDTLVNLQANTIYYFRAVGEKNGQVARGDILVFRTGSITATIIDQPTIIRNVVSGTGSGSSLVALSIDSRYETARVGDIVDYTVKYRNISGRELSDVIVRVQMPKELRFERSTRGEFSDSENTLTVIIGTLRAGVEGEFSLQTTVLRRPSSSDLIVATAVLAYRSPSLLAQDEAIAYETINVGGSRSSLGALSLFGGGGFLPDTLVEWLLLALFILGIVVLARRYALKKAA